MTYESQTLRKAILTSVKNLWFKYDWAAYALLVGVIFGSSI